MTETHIFHIWHLNSWIPNIPPRVTNCIGSDTLSVRFAFLTVLGFPTEDLVGLGLLILLQFLHVTLLISVCFIKVALGKKCEIVFKKLRC